jgi:hypothetical protein
MNTDFKIIVAEEDFLEFQKYLSSMGFRTPNGNNPLSLNYYKPFFMSRNKIIDTVSGGETHYNKLDFPEYQFVKTVVYSLEEVREKITIGEKTYYKDELEVALKNIKPI